MSSVVTDTAEREGLGTAAFAPGQQVVHPEFGDGVVTAVLNAGLIRVFFGAAGERQVPGGSLAARRSREHRILANVAAGEDRLRRAWLAYEAHALPLMESASALTAAKIDLLPHQVVLTHRVATASPRRFLIADEVGLGKTIETALVLRELASRAELRRSLMVVPAGLVSNWHRELNEVFHLGFEVFGSEGDVTDRKTNAFAKHDRLIASIDTLKRPARVKRLLDAEPWDLVVFDEAHHLTAARQGNKVRKTENYKLAEALRDHTRDLLLLSATPHQGAHFPFYMLVQLLHPTLFKSAEDMVENRHRLNAVVFRRTKADACAPDGSPLFARRWVHTEATVMSDAEKRFYGELREYLEDGFALAKRKGNQGRALGFVMAIFQKIAASSFAAVRRTLRRRMLMLTVHEAILKDQDLDIDGRQRLYDEARALIHEEYGFPDDPIGRGEADRVLADLRVRLLRKLDDEELAHAAEEGYSESGGAGAEDLAAFAVTTALPEERQRIRTLLTSFPPTRETKVDSLLRAVGTLWANNPDEKIVVFATYLGTVELLEREIAVEFPDKGVVVLRGGDHGAKLAAERRFRSPRGPRVLVCTAAGREGINLQFARVLFNFDLPWNPMDVEQRIGRIHRYGQNHTAQVYNLVLSDTIEGRIYLLLQSKLLEIAKALGKVDEHGNVAEDLRSQILGQLSERLSYDRLYQDALSDPELRRTRLELEAALQNASEARQVVFELFQDLDRFSLEDYLPYADTGRAMNRLRQFVALAMAEQGRRLVPVSETVFEIRDGEDRLFGRYTTDREEARAAEGLELLGIDHPLVQQELARWRSEPPESLGCAVARPFETPGVLTWWVVDVAGKGGETRSHVVSLAVGPDGQRQLMLERQAAALLAQAPRNPALLVNEREALLRDAIEPALHRELQHRGILNGDRSGFGATLIGWLEAV
jgi:superfamily II DNA or RNA helicase